MADPLKPLCFVLMPFGKKKDPKGGQDIDFDRIFSVLALAIDAAGMEPIRADGETTGGIIHKAMFERLLLCEYAVADLTTANPNVFYELGVRHAGRPRSTVAVFAAGRDIPFDLRYLRCLPYQLGPDNALDTEQASRLQQALTDALHACRTSNREACDSPLFQLLQGYQPPPLGHMVTDTFRDRARYSEALRARIAKARRSRRDDALPALQAIEAELSGHMDAVELAALIDLYLSYRAIEAWDAMVSLYEAMPEELKRTVMVREQLAFALNRRGQSDDREQALELLTSVEAERGANSETCGLLGRVHKDRWNSALKAGDEIAASGHLDAALDAYLRGYEADPCDSYPGVNAVTLLEIRGRPGDLAERDRLLPVVRFAVERSLRSHKPDYWDCATLLELSVLATDRQQASTHLSRAIASIREVWEPKTTANNLTLIANARDSRQQPSDWIRAIIAALLKPRA